MESILSPILLAIHIMLAAALIGVVLLQRSEGGLGGLGGGGGMSGFMTSRGSANLLTRTTRWLAGAFMATSLVLAWLASQSHQPSSIATQPPVQSEAPAVPTQEETSGQASPPADSGATGDASGQAAPAPPAAPAVPTSQ